MTAVYRCDECGAEAATRRSPMGWQTLWDDDAQLLRHRCVACRERSQTPPDGFLGQAPKQTKAPASKPKRVRKAPPSERKIGDGPLFTR